LDARLVIARGYIRDNAANLFIADAHGLDLEIECVAHPRDCGELEQQTDLTLIGTLEHRRLRIEAEQTRGPPKVGLEDLSDVHTARHTERVEHDVHRAAVGEERHVLLGNDTGNDTLVAVTSGHLVADGDLSLLRHVNLHELNDARRQLVRLQHTVDSLLRLLLELGLLFVGQIDDGADALVHLLVFHTESLEIERAELHLTQHGRGELRARRNSFLDGSRLERKRNRLTIEQVQQLHVTHFVDANFLFALESADLANTLAAILLDDLVFDA